MSKKLTAQEGADLRELDAWLAAVEETLGAIPVSRLRLLLAIADNEARGLEVAQNWYAERLGRYLPDGSADGGFVADHVRGLLGLRSKEKSPALIQQDRFENDRRSVLLRLTARGRSAIQDLVRKGKA